MAKSLYAKLLRKYGTPLSGYLINQHALRMQEEIMPRIQGFLEAPAPDAGTRITIIGAGFAGLSAAYYLRLKGYDVTVYEARNRVGGRVYSRRDFATGQIIEFGAELIGANHPFWVSMALRYGLSFNMVTPESLFSGALLEEPLIIEGRSIGEEEAIKLTRNMEYILEKRLVPLAEQVNWRFPWESPRAQEFDSKSLFDWFIEEITPMTIPDSEKNLLMQALTAEYENNNVVSLQKQSLLGILAQTKAGGGQDYWSLTEVYRCSAGNDMLATKLKEEMMNMGVSVNLECQVAGIEIKDDLVRVGIRTKSGQDTRETDYVVLATPPSVWDKISLEPGVREYKSQTGNAIKYMAAVNSRFWIKDKMAPSGLCGDIGMTWEGSDNQVELPGKEMDLSSFCGGPTADKILQMAPADRSLFYDERLNSIFSGYKESKIRSHLQDWPAEEWTKTGYSFPAPGEVCSKIKMLNTAPYKNRIFFAGEHTSTGFCGYMEGALGSGYSVAEQITKHVEASMQQQLTE